VDTFYFHKPNTYSYRGVNSYIQCIKFCTCVENVTITLFPLFIKHSLMISVNEHSFQLYAIIINKSYIKLLTLQEHLNSPPVFSGVRVTRSLVLYACFVDRCLSFCTISFGHCVVCSSLIYGLWLSLWYLQTLLSISNGIVNRWWKIIPYLTNS